MLDPYNSYRAFGRSGWLVMNMTFTSDPAAHLSFDRGATLMADLGGQGVHALFVVTRKANALCASCTRASACCQACSQEQVDAGTREQA